MTFLQSLRKQLRQSSPVGDLARDALTSPDPDMPRGQTTRARWHGYLSIHHACDGAMEALDDAWDAYDELMRFKPGPRWDAEDLHVEVC
jgi:hypothetical protein